MGKSKKLAKNQSKQREKLVAGRDALVRMNYLLQISNAMAVASAGARSGSGSMRTAANSSEAAVEKPTSASLASLSRFYARNMKQVGARMVLRLDPSVKRAVCKRCDSILIPGLSASVEVVDDEQSGTSAIVTTCNLCGRPKRLPCVEGYVLFNDRPGVLVAKDGDDEEVGLTGGGEVHIEQEQVTGMAVDEGVGE